MIPRTLAEVAAATGGTLVGDPLTRIDRVTTDTRSLPADDHGAAPLFVALRGSGGDGHDHVASARHRGARAVLVERVDELGGPAVVVADTWRALRDLAADERRRAGPRAVAITGSVGKTTVKDFTAAAIGAGRRVHASQGSFNNELGVPLTLLGMPEHTEVVVAEIGARHVGDIADLAPLVAPDVAVVTAVAAVHLEIFGSIEQVALAKRELVEALGPDGLAVLHVGDPRVAAMADRAPAVLTVATDLPAADVTAQDVELDALGRPRATAVTPWGRAPFELPVTGRHQVANALLALATACHLGVDLDAAAVALADSPVSPWRGAVAEVRGVVLLDDAYNASPTSVNGALDTLSIVDCPGDRWAVLGEMAELGPTSEADHRGVGARCATLGIDHLVVVGGAAEAIAAGAEQAGPVRVHRVAGAQDAVGLLLAGLAPGDAVLVKASRVAGLDRIGRALRAAWEAAS